MNGFLTFRDRETAERFLRSSDCERLSTRAELSPSSTQPMVIINALPDDLVGFVAGELATRWSARFTPSRRYAPLAV